MKIVDDKTVMFWHRNVPYIYAAENSKYFVRWQYSNVIHELNRTQDHGWTVSNSSSSLNISFQDQLSTAHRLLNNYIADKILLEEQCPKQ